MSPRFDVYGRTVFEGDRSYWYGENVRPQSDLSRRCDDMAKELQAVEQQIKERRDGTGKPGMDRGEVGQDHGEPVRGLPEKQP